MVGVRSLKNKAVFGDIAGDPDLQNVITGLAELSEE